MSRPRLAAIILTLNEERDLPGCLESLRGVADEVFVIDSGSTDGTVSISEAASATVLIHRFENHGRQLNWALDNVATDADWMIKIDADERMSPELGQSLRTIVEGCEPDVAAVLVPLRIQFLGKRLRFGGTFPTWLLRMWRRGHGRCEERWMDEHIQVPEGRAVRAEGELLHQIPKSLTEWCRKHIWYAERECVDAQSENEENGLRGQAARVRKMKTGVYYRMPPIMRVVAYFVYRYVFQLGFLDGKVGFLYHFLQCAWYRMLVDAILEEREVREAMVERVEVAGSGLR